MRSIFCLGIGAWLMLAGIAMPDALPNQPADELNSILAHAIDPAGPGVSVIVSRGGQVLFSHAYGMENREKQIPATVETRFRIGSLTKQFTAAAILKLDGENRLSLKDPISRYFPGYPNGDRITIYQLLTHTSGIHNYTVHEDFLYKVLSPVKEDDLLNYFKDDPADFEPGQEFRYTNSGYALLGQIVEQVTGSKLGHYFETQFFRPLGMQETGVYANANPPERAARGYSFLKGTFQPAPDWNMTWAGGAACLYSTTGDLCRWTEALESGRVLQAPALKTMTTEVSVPRKETLVGYCMGLYRSELGWLPTIGHNGALSGFSGLATWFPNQKTAIVVLSNAEPTQMGQSPEEILSIVAHFVLREEIAQNAPHMDPSANPALYGDYVGRYDYHGTVQQITLENGHLYGQLTGQQRFEIFPSGPDHFFYKIVEARIVFNRDESGQVISITHTQNGTTFTAMRLLEPTPSSTPTKGRGP